jgi:Acyl-CoA dehydrogenase, C-terminal domain
MAKVIVPSMCLAVIDRAIQVHGGAGVSQDFPLANMYAMMRTLRIADGPDEVLYSSYPRCTAGRSLGMKLKLPVSFGIDTSQGRNFSIMGFFALDQ